MKKTLITLTASAVIASSYTSTAEAGAYKVKKGDSLWLIAQNNELTVAKLKSINNLKNNIIFPNQVLQTATATTKQKPSEIQQKEKAPSTNATTYKVKSGDSLSKIAAQHNISLSELMSWNKLTTTLIFPGDVFQVSKPGSRQPDPPSAKEKTEQKKHVPTEKVTTYRVKSGDYLGKIAKNFNVSVQDLKNWNSLSSDLIMVGQKLSVKDTDVSVETPKEETAAVTLEYSVDKLISEGKSFLGLPYVWGGSTPSGFDCSGFIYYLYSKAGKSIGRYSSDGYFNRSFYVNKPVAGDLVFFSGTYRPGISHLGIYLGDNKFLHAGNNGVEISNLSNSYWKKHFDSFKRLY